MTTLGVFLIMGWMGYAQETVISDQVPISFSTAYLQAAKGQAVFYSGKEQYVYPTYYEGHPYLVAVEPVTGTVVYDGITYPDIRMRLDLYRDELVVSLPEGNYNVVLQPERVNYADLHSCRLIYYYPDGLKGCPVQGYHILLREGAYPVLERPSAKLMDVLRGTEREVYFEQSQRFFIRRDEAYYTVKSKSSLLKVFPSHKKELNQFIKQHKLNFRKETGKAIVAVVEEYERLTKQP